MRKYLAEFFGTLLLVLIGTSSAVYYFNTIGPVPIALAFGIIIIAGAYSFGAISGAHFNPAVSFAAAITKRITWTEFVFYVIAQILGAFAGTGLLVVLTTALKMPGANFGQTDFVKPVTPLIALLVELVLTFILVLVILLTSSEKYGTQNAPLAIGLTITALILVGIFLTGASMNPARSLTPAVFAAFLGKTSSLTHFWVYLVGPTIGGGLAAVVAKYGFGSEED
ncbi:MAG: aquaporin [Lactobacillaceae bacterium]|jgi:aquaporin Z|nr:aquaporin [Lactobacillaceae bacterium]